jgi:hypothetical protein
MRWQRMDRRTRINRRALLSMMVSWLLIGSVMNIEGQRLA